MSDLIDRQEAIDALTEDEYREFWDCIDSSVAADIIRRLPPAEPKRGKWVLVCDNNGMHFICNKCGAWRYHQEQNFCGECGAKMER